MGTGVGRAVGTGVARGVARGVGESRWAEVRLRWAEVRLRWAEVSAAKCGGRAEQRAAGSRGLRACLPL